MTVATLGYTMVICGSNDEQHYRYRGRIEKVKFGVPIEEAFAHDIPATLLVLLLKVHKDGPEKKDIWRAPGNQAQVRKLSHIMQNGRLVNIANFSVYTAASVVKKFLSKLPGGIFGLENEQKLFDIYNQTDPEMQQQSFCRVLCSLATPSQHFLVLLFGTFYTISESADSFGSSMTTEALGISVAPSLFHSCIHNGQRAKMEDVMRFKIASEVISRIIQYFGYASLFPRECYEFYARITGRTLRIDENDSRLRFAIPFNEQDWPLPPPSAFSMMAAQCAGSYSMGTVAAIDQFGSDTVFAGTYSQQDVLLVSSSAKEGEPKRRHRHIPRPATCRAHPTVYERLSSSAGEVQLAHSDDDGDGEFSANALHGAGSLDSTHSLTYLEWVHERQTRRMRTRSEWFLSPALPAKNNGVCRPKGFECPSHEFPSSRSQYDDSYASSMEDPLGSPEFAKRCDTCATTSQSMHAEVLGGEALASTSQASEAGGRSSGGVVRRRSWRTHYVRPKRDIEEAKHQGVGGSVSCESTPVYRRSVAHTLGGSVQNRGLCVLPKPIVKATPSPILSTSSTRGAAATSSRPKNVHF